MVKRTRNLPLPLGGNVIAKNVPPEIRHEISDILRESIAYGLEHRSPLYCTAWRMPVDWTFLWQIVSQGCMCRSPTGLWKYGRAAVSRFLGEAVDQRLIPPVTGLEFEN